MTRNNISLGKIKGKVFSSEELLTEGELNHHVHIVGASGFGKTVLLSHIVKQTIEQGKGLLFIDLKGDIETIEKFTQFVVSNNRKEDLQMLSLADQTSSLNYNLIKVGTATQLKDKIMSSLVWSEEYYKHQSSSFLLRLLIGLCFLRDVKHKSFGLNEILQLASSQELLECLYLEVKEVKCGEVNKVLEQIKSTIDFLGIKENFSSLQGLRSQLESLVLSDFGNLISKKEGGIDLFKSIQENKITYIFLDSRRYSESSKAVGKFILQDLKMVSARIDSEIKKVDRKPFTVIVDEFADLAQEDFIGFLDRARSSKMSIIVAHQEICDLLRISPEFAGRLMGNTSTLYAFLQKRPESAEMISSMAGTRKAWKETLQSQKLFFIDIPTGGKSLREVEEFNIHPNVIKSLTVGKCVVIKKYPKSRAYVVAVAPENNFKSTP